MVSLKRRGMLELTVKAYIYFSRFWVNMTKTEPQSEETQQNGTVTKSHPTCAWNPKWSTTQLPVCVRRGLHHMLWLVGQTLMLIQQRWQIISASCAKDKVKTCHAKTKGSRWFGWVLHISLQSSFSGEVRVCGCFRMNWFMNWFQTQRLAAGSTLQHYWLVSAQRH